MASQEKVENSLLSDRGGCHDIKFWETIARLLRKFKKQKRKRKKKKGEKEGGKKGIHRLVGSKIQVHTNLVSYRKLHSFPNHHMAATSASALAEKRRI
jgi:hypothetical protein